MANYNLVTTSTFQPFTYNELMAPIQEIEKSYADTESSMTDLESKVSLIKNTLPEESKEYQMANSFLNDLNKGIEDLQNNGVSSTTSRKMLELNRKYNTELLPIAQKTEILKKAQDTRSQILVKDPSAIFISDLPSVSDINLGESIDNTVLPTEDLLKNVITETATNVYNVYDGSGTFDYSDINTENIKSDIGKAYGIDLDDPKYLRLKQEVDSAIDSSIITAVEARRKEHEALKTERLNRRVKSLELNAATLELGTQPFILNEEGTIIPNPLIFDNKGNYTTAGTAIYEKGRNKGGNKDGKNSEDNKLTPEYSGSTIRRYSINDVIKKGNFRTSEQTPLDSYSEHEREVFNYSYFFDDEGNIRDRQLTKLPEYELFKEIYTVYGPNYELHKGSDYYYIVPTKGNLNTVDPEVEEYNEWERKMKMNLEE